MKNINIKLATAFLALLSLGACTDDLNQTDPANQANVSVDELYSSPEAYLQNLAKLYAGFATTGQNGPAGSPDISGIDEGFSQYIRGLWLMQELTTDEAVIGWNDQTIKDFHSQTWSSSDNFINATWSRLDFEIKNCNEFLRQTSDEKLTARGVNDELRAQISVYRAEARFLRAVSYWHFLDLFGGRVGLVTENDPVTYFLPKQATAQELFDFITSDDPRAHVEYQSGAIANYLPTKKFKLTVNPEEVSKNKVVSAAQMNNLTDSLTWNYNSNLILKNNLSIIDILAHNKWKRPICFTVTAGSSNMIGLDNYLYREGFTMRLLPLKPDTAIDDQSAKINSLVMYDNVMNKFKFGNYKHARFLDEQSVTMFYPVLTTTFMTLADGLMAEGRNDMALKVLRK
ncbi:MAG: hypothetical protein EOP54_16880, partial [Sphingobacteriales bacterium]